MTHAHTYARTHTHGVNYNLPPACRAGDKKNKSQIPGHNFIKSSLTFRGNRNYNFLENLQMDKKVHGGVF